jgi:hypothetical protein
MLVSWLERAGCQRIVLLDNASTYEPLLEYLRASPHDVLWLPRNRGSRALWNGGWDEWMYRHDWFVYTDPDIVPIDECPLDAVDRLRELLGRHSDFPKAGLGLYLDDLPADFPHRKWETGPEIDGPQLEPGAVTSLVDTTFALYRPGSDFVYKAIRTKAPYLARHVSPAWYGGPLTDEDVYYFDHALPGPEGSSWKGP